MLPGRTLNAKRQAKFKLKFDRGRKYIKDVFRKVSGDLDLPEPEQIVVLQLQAEVLEKSAGRGWLRCASVSMKSMRG